MSDWTLHNPHWLWALLLLPLIAFLRNRRRVPVLVVPFAAEWHRPATVAHASWPATVAYFGIALLIVAMARPQAVEQTREDNQKGYDIVLAIDLSGSMLAEDYEREGRPINRLQAVKPVLEAFINRRPTDRIGLVVFAGRAYTMAPLTFDHDWLRRQTARLQVGLLEDGTAIGDGLGVALSRLEQARRNRPEGNEGAFVVLLTDGANNAGALDPREATRIAEQRGVTVYTIGAGREGVVPIPVFDAEGNIRGRRQILSDLDEPLLREIAERTGGRYFRAADSDTIAEAFAAIDQARKVEFKARSYVVTAEWFAWPAAAGLVLLALTAGGTLLRLRREVFA
ncbi:MAG: VWA domain-containing protein [Verrucomicrobia bacterium]|nr:MAG: VWA domain-containing protein [Verrucomicrobiota bacterium]